MGAQKGVKVDSLYEAADDMEAIGTVRVKRTGHICPLFVGTGLAPDLNELPRADCWFWVIANLTLVIST